MKRLFLYLVCLPADIIAWLAVLLIWALWGQKLHWNEGLWCELKEGSWFRHKFYMKWGGTTLGHGGFYNVGKTKGPGTDTYIEFHELIHVEQFEAGMLRIFMINCIVFAFTLFAGQIMLGLAIIATLSLLGAILTFAPNWLTALLRGEEAYMGSHHEESAYAQTELKVRKDREK